MFSLTPENQAVLFPFASLFSMSVWRNASILAIGSILCIGKRTVTSALKVMGLKNDKHFTNYHRVLNRAKWNSLNGAKILLGLIIHLTRMATSKYSTRGHFKILHLILFFIP